MHPANHPNTISVSEPASHVQGMVQGRAADGILYRFLMWLARLAWRIVR